MPTVIEAITNRSSKRKYLNKSVPKDIQEKILNVAQMTPSGANMQPWVTYAISNAEVLKNIGDAIIEKMDEGIMNDQFIQYYPVNWVNDESEKNANHTSSFTENVSIRFQKNINEENSVVMLDFGQQSYLVLMGKNNILLDKFTDNKPETQEDFETILQNRHQELDDFIRVESTTTRTSPKEPLQAYKERAASIIYES